MKLPANIEKVLEGKEYRIDSIGKSDSQVMIFVYAGWMNCFNKRKVFTD